MAIAILLCLGAPLGASVNEASNTVHALKLPASSPIKKTVKAPSMQATSVHISVPTTTAAPAPTPPPACTPFTGSTNPKPAASLAPGVHIITDTPSQYAVYGTTEVQIRQQMQACAPGHEFSGSTGFWIGSNYSYTTSGDGLCTLNGVSVTLRIKQIFPHWSSDTAAPLALQAEWQNYIAALQAHETGHSLLNVRYAHRALATLKALPPTACSQINETVTRTMNQITAAMNQANESYDVNTQHGATQGAIWP